MQTNGDVDTSVKLPRAMKVSQSASDNASAEPRPTVQVANVCTDEQPSISTASFAFGSFAFGNTSTPEIVATPARQRQPLPPASTNDQAMTTLARGDAAPAQENSRTSIIVPSNGAGQENIFAKPIASCTGKEPKNFMERLGQLEGLMFSGPEHATTESSGLCGDGF